MGAPFTPVYTLDATADAAGGALALLSGETDGFAIDATGSVGTVAVIDTGTPANDIDNGLLSLSNLTNAGGSSKIVRWGDGMLRAFAVGDVAQEWDGTQYGIIVEPAATNILARSESFASAANWTATLIEVTANATTAPDGELTADLMVEHNSTTGHVFENIVAATPSTTYTCSIFLKYKALNNWVQIGWSQENQTSRVRGWFNLATGTMGSATSVGTASGATIDMIAFADGWYRCILTGIHSTTETSGKLQIRSCPSNLATDHVANSEWYGWGAQIELGSVATSYIRTEASAATRQADNISLDLTTIPYGDANTAYVSAKAKEVAIQHDVLVFDADDANEAESVKLYTDTSANILMQMQSVDVDQLAPLDSGVNATANTTFQITGAWETDSVDISANGTAPVNDALADMAVPTRLRLGCNPAVGNHLNGYIYKVVVVPRQVETEDGDVENWRYA
jgi:hypothetical protein